jgi:Raf kinase inhibitor-like YbhB/YbcL family protein
MTYLTLTSPAFPDEGRMPDRFTLDGGNVSPPLVWTGVPEDAVELVLMCEDEDVKAEPFLHWLVTGIDPSSSGVGEGEVPPSGQEWTNDFGKVGWGGPQPPAGEEPHRYFFRLYALPAPAELPEDPKVDDVRESLLDETLACAVLVGLYSV